MTEPTNGEVMRRLDEVSRQLVDIVTQLRQDYVRRDVYDARHSALSRDVAELEAARAEDQKFARDSRRQLVMLALTIAIPALLALLLAVNNFLAAKAGG